jgi:hypothetical protein
MAEFVFPELTFGWPEKLSAGAWLWIWNADKVPPHIAVSHGPNYFSLTYRGCEIRKNVSAMVRKARRTAIPLVLVNISDWPFERDFTAIFERYDRAKVGGPTCLTPVKEVLALPDRVAQLAELLTEIEKHRELKQVFAVNLNRTYRGIPPYTVSEIMSRIELLHEAQRSESTIAPR